MSTAHRRIALLTGASPLAVSSTVEQAPPGQWTLRELAAGMAVRHVKPDGKIESIELVDYLIMPDEDPAS